MKWHRFGLFYPVLASVRCSGGLGMDAVTRLAPAAQWNGTRVPHLNRYLPLSLAPWVALICL